MPHKRTDIPQDDQALRCLSGCQYKVLQALVNRADERGIAFPGDEYLARATGYTRRSVQRSLAALAEAFVIQYRRKDAWDDETRRQLSNVMQINPDYICLAEAFEPEARELWRALTEKCGNDSVRLWSRTITNTKQPIPEPTPGSSASDPTPKTTTPGKAKGQAADKNTPHGQRRSAGGSNTKKQNPDGETGQRAATTNQRAKPAEQTGSAGRPQYANPESINTNLPDREHELLADKLRQFGISMALARGFVAEYGYKRVKAGLEAVQEMGDKARQPAAVFRSIVQIRLAEDYALAQEQIFRMRKQ